MNDNRGRQSTCIVLLDLVALSRISNPVYYKQRHQSTSVCSPRSIGRIYTVTHILLIIVHKNGWINVKLSDSMKNMKSKKNRSHLLSYSSCIGIKSIITQLEDAPVVVSTPLRALVLYTGHSYRWTAG